MPPNVSVPIACATTATAACAARLRLADDLARRFGADATAMYAATAAEVLMPFGDTPEFPMAEVRADFEADRRQRARAALDAARAQGLDRVDMGKGARQRLVDRLRGHPATPDGAAHG